MSLGYTTAHACNADSSAGHDISRCFLVRAEPPQCIHGVLWQCSIGFITIDPPTDLTQVLFVEGLAQSLGDLIVWDAGLPANLRRTLGAPVHGCDDGDPLLRCLELSGAELGVFLVYPAVLAAVHVNRLLATGKARRP